MTELQFTNRIEEGVRTLPKPPSMAEHFAAARKDIEAGIRNWRMWLLLGMNDIRQRYRRSRLGQFWITLAMAVTISALGVLYAYLFRQPLEKYLPYLGVSFVVWGYISSIVLEACTVYIASEGYIRQVPMPKSIFVHRMLVRNGIILAHNLAILPPLLLIFGVPIGWSILLAPLGIVLITINGVWVGLVLGTICARFRDMPQIITSLMQVVFYLTPVVWRPSQLPDRLSWLTNFNPFQSFLDIVRDPLLGQTPKLLAWKVAITVTIIGYGLAALVFSRFRSRIVFWL